MRRLSQDPKAQTPRLQWKLVLGLQFKSKSREPLETPARLYSRSKQKQ